MPSHQRIDGPACAARPAQQIASVVGDFADPLSFLASQRVDRLHFLRLGRVQWLAVESDRGRPLPGRPLGDALAQNTAALSLAGETVPAADAIAANSRAATAAYAESVTDGVCDAMRRALYGAAWVDGRPIGDPDVIRRIVFEVLNPDGGRLPISERVQANRSVVAFGDPDPIANTRRLGYVVTPARGPLTQTGQKRIDRWREMWQNCGAPSLPLLITKDAARHAGPDALHWLASPLAVGTKPSFAAGGRDRATLSAESELVRR